MAKVNKLINFFIVCQEPQKTVVQSILLLILMLNISKYICKYMY